ncbi:hypothetical protein [Streptomyces sp. NBC_00842]|uniref:hypothetical protein n=1 Tax=unclassified Streptomyces TaxID=2593676 RepID=UPI00386A0F3E
MDGGRTDDKDSGGSQIVVPSSQLWLEASVRVLDHVPILGESHVWKVLTDYQDHCNGHRAQRSRQQLPPSATEQPAIVHDLDDRSLLRTRVFGGIINEYRYAAGHATTTFRAPQAGELPLATTEYPDDGARLELPSTWLVVGRGE